MKSTIEHRHNPETRRLMEVLDTLKKTKGLSMYQIAQKIDYLPQSFSRVRSGGQNLPSRIIHKICEIYGINKAYIYTGEFPIFLDIKKAKVVAKAAGKEIEKKASPIMVPYYDAHLSAGMMKKFGDNVINPSYFITIPYFVECSLALRVSGDSMYPKYRSGDIVVCKHIQDRSTIMHGEPYVVITPDYCVVKYVDPHHSDKSKLVLRSENPKFKPTEIHKKEVLQMYIIKGKIEIL
jgi:phage repressor protein C with HTH and peptisase S24 domain